VLADGFFRAVEQLAHERLGQPDGFIDQTALDSSPAVFGLVDDQIAFGLVAHDATPIFLRMSRRALSVSLASASMASSSAAISPMGR